MTNSGEVDNQEQIISEAQRTSSLKLDELPSEILLLIFDYCDAFDLVRLSAVCTRFYDIAQDDILWYKWCKKTLATNQVSKRFRSRCNPLLDARTKLQVNHNWEYGRYQSKVLLSQNTKLMPWIQLTRNTLWWGGGNHMSGLHRGDSCNPRSRFWHENTGSDIGKFIVRDEYLISGHRDGSIKFWMKGCRYRGNHYYCSIEKAHSKDVDAVEETNNIIISGAVDGLVKAWTSPTNQEYISNMPLATLRVNNRVKSLAVDPTGRKLAIGCSGIGGGPALNICDTSTFSHFDEITHNWRRDAGIMDLVWENPQTLLTCGYDTCIRKWDLRVGKCVSFWTDPTDATIYCISSDYNYTMVTGTQFNCKAVLWDQRKTQYVQLYFMNLTRMSSPIYSISFDSSHLYAATDQNVVEMKFSGKPDIVKNYREILKYEKFISIEG